MCKVPQKVCRICEENSGELTYISTPDNQILVDRFLGCANVTVVNHIYNREIGKQFSSFAFSLHTPTDYQSIFAAIVLTPSTWRTASKNNAN